MLERLQKILSSRGVCSRRGAEKIIQAGRVTVNGLAAGLGDKADPDKDEIRVDGRVLCARPEALYIMLNKPRGYITSMRDEKGRQDIRDLIRDVPARVYPVGRLDYDSEGLLLLTNDGDFAEKIAHPSMEKDKIYRVRVKGNVKRGAQRLLQPMEIDGVSIRTPRVEILSQSGEHGTLRIAIHEGRNRQVRKMCAQAKLEVLNLKRVAIGSLELRDLPSGKWRYLTKEEQEKLLS